MTSERSGGERTEFQTAEEQHELLKHRKYLSIVNCMPKRYVVGIMAFFGFCNIYALRVNLSVAIVAMTENQTKHIGGNKTVTIYPDFTYDAHTKGIILGSFFYGYILTQIPGGYLATRLGGKYLFGGGVFLTALFTLITPLCARWSVYLLVAVRVLEGLFEGVTYPSIHAIWSKWAPPQEKTKLATLAFSGSYIGTVISLPMSAALAQTSAGWPSIFYVFGSIAVLWFFMWCYLVAESPAKHPTISNAELEYIQGNIGYTDEQVQDVSPPWRSILTSLPVWAIVAAHFAENWGFYTWLTELPTFMNNVLHFNMYQIIALISDSWVNTVTDADGTVGSAGLWRTCADYAGIDSCRGFVWSDNQVSHWFRTVQTLEVIGFLFGAVALFLFALYHMVEMCMDNRVLKLSAIGLLMLAFLLVFCGTIVVASLKDVQKAIELPKTEAVVSWGFGLSLTASILYLAGGVVVAISPQP